MVATYIEDKGFIRFSQIGGLYVGDLLNIQVKFANGHARRDLLRRKDAA